MAVNTSASLKHLRKLGQGRAKPEWLTLAGNVTSGRGVAKSHIRENSEELESIIGEGLFEGSLNIILKRPAKFIDENAALFDNDSRLLWIARLNGTQVWVYRWRAAPLHVVELISTLPLRQSLNLHDGSQVSIEVQRADLGEISNTGKLVWTLVWLGRRNWCYKNDSYYFRTRNWCVKFGATQQSSTKNMWDLTLATVKALIKRIPGTVVLATRLGLVDRPSGVSHISRSFQRMPLTAMRTSAERVSQQVQNLLNYTKVSGSAYAANVYPAGYHTIVLNGERLPGQRDPSKRLENVPIDFKGRTVLDIGCNQGGMLFRLNGIVKWGVGVDYDPRMINVANRIKAVQQYDGLQFYVLDVEKEPLHLMEDLIPDPRVDVVFLLSVCMWLDNWRDVIAYGAKIGDAMIFESNGSDEQQAQQESYLKELYGDVSLLASASEDDPKQKRRRLFYCRDPRLLS